MWRQWGILRATRADANIYSEANLHTYSDRDTYSYSYTNA
jgi:hypothetical protein